MLENSASPFMEILLPMTNSSMDSAHHKTPFPQPLLLSKKSPWQRLDTSQWPLLYENTGRSSYLAAPPTETVGE